MRHSIHIKTNLFAVYVNPIVVVVVVVVVVVEESFCRHFSVVVVLNEVSEMTFHQNSKEATAT
jgi:hypothetical protein